MFNQFAPWPWGLKLLRVRLAMFDKIERDFSFGSWVLQLLAAYCAPIVLLGILETSLAVQDTSMTQLLRYAFVAAAAVALALLISAFIGGSVREGKRIWIIPVLFEVSAFVSAMASVDAGSRLRALVWVADPGRGEESWTMVLLTLPTWGCCWYSAAMWWRFCRDQRLHADPTGR